MRNTRLKNYVLMKRMKDFFKLRQEMQKRT